MRAGLNNATLEDLDILFPLGFHKELLSQTAAKILATHLKELGDESLDGENSES